MKERLEQSSFVNTLRETLADVDAGISDLNNNMMRRRPRFDGSETSKIIRRRNARRKRGLHGKF